MSLSGALFICLYFFSINFRVHLHIGLLKVCSDCVRLNEDLVYVDADVILVSWIWILFLMMMLACEVFFYARICC